MDPYQLENTKPCRFILHNSSIIEFAGVTLAPSVSIDLGLYSQNMLS